MNTASMLAHTWLDMLICAGGWSSLSLLLFLQGQGPVRQVQYNGAPGDTASQIARRQDTCAQVYDEWGTIYATICNVAKNCRILIEQGLCLVNCLLVGCSQKQLSSYIVVVRTPS